jgi:hypothetical protein
MRASEPLGFIKPLNWSSGISTLKSPDAKTYSALPCGRARLKSLSLLSCHGFGTIVLHFTGEMEWLTLR